MIFPQYQMQQRPQQVRSVADVLQMMSGMEPMYHGGAPQPQGAPRWGGNPAPAPPMLPPAAGYGGLAGAVTGAAGGQQYGQVYHSLAKKIAHHWAQKG